MRPVLLASLFLLTACGQTGESGNADARVSEATGPLTYQAGERNRLCIDPDSGRAGFIVYASESDANCSVQGRRIRSGNRLVLTPDGDSSCQIDAVEEGGALRFGPVSPACAYHCGPGASYAGQTFKRPPGPQPVTDLAGDPLC